MSDKKYPVFLFHSEPWRPSGTHYLLCPPIDSSTLGRLLTAFEKTHAPADFCLRNLTVQVRYNNHIHSNCRADNFGASCNLSTDFNPKLTCPCDTTINNVSQLGKSYLCAQNIKTGKCRDEYIRKTLGAILFPQHYATDKQK